MTLKMNRICSVFLGVVLLSVSSCGRIEIEVDETNTEAMIFVPVNEETTEAPRITEQEETTGILDPHDLDAKELYLAIHEDEIPYDTIAEYPVFRAEVEQKFSEVLGRPIAWEDLSFAIGDITDMYHYFFWIQDSEECITRIPCAVNAYRDVDGNIQNGLAWGTPDVIPGPYMFGDSLKRIDETYLINKTKLDELLAGSYDFSTFPAYYDQTPVYPVQYDGIRYEEKRLFVPVISESDEKLFVYSVAVDEQMQYQMLQKQEIDLMALSPYDFLVTHQTFGLTPQELMEYFPNHPLNPRYALSGHMGVDDILQSKYRMSSAFDTQPYIRVQDDGETDVSFGLSLPQMSAGEVLEIADITENTTYQDLAWVAWSER